MSNASLTIPTQCSALKKGGHVLIKGKPCKIVDMSTSKTGKHGSAKVHLVGIDIFTGKKCEEISPSTANMDVPEVKRSEYQVINVGDDGTLEVLLQDGSTKGDLNVPEGELGDKIRSLFDEGKDVLITVIAAMEQEMIKEVKEGKEQ